MSVATARRVPPRCAAAAATAAAARAIAVAPALMLALALASCAVGPNYHRAPAPTDDRYTPETLPAQTVSTGVTGGEPQRFEFGRDLPGEWWTLFGSAQLDTLIRQAMASYPDIAAQQAALREARANLSAQVGAFYPQLQGTAQATREQSAALAPGFPSFIYNLFYGAVNVSYTFDVFGKERRTLEGLQAQAVQQDFQLEASYLTLAANVASAAIQIASTLDQIAATHSILSLEQQQLGVVQRRFQLGSQTRADILQQQANLANVRATLPPLQQQLSQAEHQLAVLTGRSPREAAPVQLHLSDLTLPQDLPVSLPSALVAQRPDVRAQAAVVRQDSAAVGVATANMLPQLTLTGAFGGESFKFADLLSPSSNIWNLAGGITAPLFEGGTLRARRRAAVDTYQQAIAQYRLVVLQAFQNVADTLTALDNDAQALAAQHDALQTAQASLDLTQKQYAVGAVDAVTLLAAQQTYQQDRIAYVRALASRYTDTVSLFQALGGGWWHREDPGTLPGLR
ncbi:MAG TPA: efflux transporter outer membrane subunit [Steroidobacteraceae bacterium]|nr:efflux transporter outer membrane subunit [Steroidobacteraceae bacterium]